MFRRREVCLANSSHLREWFAPHEVPVYLETTSEATDASFGNGDGEATIPCDSVIRSAGYLPAPTLAVAESVRIW